VDHHFGGDFKYSRHSKRETREQVNGTMHQKVKRGLDYSPLFKFLLSKVGSRWDDVLSEAKSRLDKPDPIFWLVSLDDLSKKEIVRLGESSYFSGLFVDTEGILQLVNPNLKTEDLKHYCTCCTHTFNGKPY
jgi:hypothetical protein